MGQSRVLVTVLLITSPPDGVSSRYCSSSKDKDVPRKRAGVVTQSCSVANISARVIMCVLLNSVVMVRSYKIGHDDRLFLAPFQLFRGGTYICFLFYTGNCLVRLGLGGDASLSCNTA